MPLLPGSVGDCAVSPALTLAEATSTLRCNGLKGVGMLGRLPCALKLVAEIRPSAAGCVHERTRAAVSAMPCTCSQRFQ